jgi:methylated-DNA-[protein]-cysteine S-methyltransferase
MKRCFWTMDSPVGELTLVASDGALAGVYMREHRYMPDPVTFGSRQFGPLAAASEQLAEYFAGQRQVFDVAVALAGTVFQQRVWRALLEVPFGQTVTYGGLARRLGVARGSRAVGLANGRNPVSVVVPCHRVVGADGGLTGYGGGVANKRFLLDFERQVSGATLW